MQNYPVLAGLQDFLWLTIIRYVLPCGMKYSSSIWNVRLFCGLQNYPMECRNILLSLEYLVDKKSLWNKIKTRRNRRHPGECIHVKQAFGMQNYPVKCRPTLRNAELVCELRSLICGCRNILLICTATDAFCYLTCLLYMHLRYTESSNQDNNLNF